MVVVSAITALLLVGGGLGIYLLTADDGTLEAAGDTTTVTESTLTQPTGSTGSTEPTGSSEPTDSEEPTESTIATGTPSTSSSGRPSYTGQQPSRGIYLSLATQLVELGASQECDRARALLTLDLERTLPDDQLCAGEAADLFDKVDTADYDFKNFNTAGAYVDFINNGVTVNVGMSFQDGEVFVDSLFVYATG